MLCLKKITLFIILTLLVVTSLEAKVKRTGSYVPGEVLFKFKESVDEVEINSKMNQLGKKNLKTLRKKKDRSKGTQKHSMVHYKFKDRKVEDVIAELNSDPDIEYAQPNYLYQITATPADDSFYSSQWGLKNTEQIISSPAYSTNNPGVYGKDMDLENAWEYMTDCTAKVVAILDSGVNYNHEELSTNMWDGSSCVDHLGVPVGGGCTHGYDYVDDDSDPMDFNGHGTHVSGTIGAAANNTAGTVGICWEASIMAVRTHSTFGNGTTAAVINGIDFAINNGANIMNFSFGSYVYDVALETVINDATTAGILVVAGAGNDGVDSDSTPFYPCSYADVLCVAALDQAYELADFSNYGSTSVDVGAPGVNIISPIHGQTVSEIVSLSSGWSTAAYGAGSTWGFVPSDTSCLTGYDLLVLPTDFCLGGPYLDDTDSSVWKDISSMLTGYSTAYIGIGLGIQAADAGDRIGITVADSVPTDPFILAGGVHDYTLQSVTDGYWVDDYWITEIYECFLTSQCGVGFNVQSNASGTDLGAAVFDFDFYGVQTNSTTYAIFNGTSRASPHVAGLAALIWSLNPTYTASEVRDAIYAGGDVESALVGKTATGKAVDAYGSMKYIMAPTGLGVSAL